MISLAFFVARSRQCGPIAWSDTASKCKLNLRNEILILASPLLSVITSLPSVPFNLHKSDSFKECFAFLRPEISHISAPKLNSRETWNQSCIFKELRDIDPENGYLIEIEFMFSASETLYSFKRFSHSLVRALPFSPSPALAKWLFVLCRWITQS